MRQRRFELAGSWAAGDFETAGFEDRNRGLHAGETSSTMSNSITESVVEECSLDWLRELGYEVLSGLTIAPGEPAAERGRDHRRLGQRRGRQDDVPGRLECAETLPVHHQAAGLSGRPAAQTWPVAG
jgi:hypothetical protein